MGFLRNLWDESLTSDSDIGKFRRYNSLICFSNNNNNNNNHLTNVDITPVSRTITIVRNNTLSGSAYGSTPSSPAGSSAAGSPFSATSSSPGQELKKLTRRKSTANRRESKSPTGYDWIVLTLLDR